MTSMLKVIEVIAESDTRVGRMSRNDNSEADRNDLDLTARAGYDPRAGVTLPQKMMSASPGGRPPGSLSSHPAETSRAQQFQSLLLTVLPLYEAARRG